MIRGLLAHNLHFKPPNLFQLEMFIYKFAQNDVVKQFAVFFCVASGMSARRERNTEKQNFLNYKLSECARTLLTHMALICRDGNVCANSWCFQSWRKAWLAWGDSLWSDDIQVEDRSTTSRVARRKRRKMQLQQQGIETQKWHKKLLEKQLKRLISANLKQRATKIKMENVRVRIKHCTNSVLVPAVFCPLRLASILSCSFVSDSRYSLRTSCCFCLRVNTKTSSSSSSSSKLKWFELRGFSS